MMIALIGVFWFEVPLRGNPFVLLLGAVLFLMSSVAIGLFISTICSTQQQAQISTFFFTMPAFTLSGFAFPIENMPEWIQYPDLCQPAALFSGHHSRRLFKGEWPGYPLASDAGIRHIGHTHDSFEFPKVPEEIEMKKGSRIREFMGSRVYNLEIPLLSISYFSLDPLNP